MRPLTIVKNLALLAPSLMAALVLVELILRFSFPVLYLKPPQEIDAEDWKTMIHQASPVPGLPYELAPSREKDHYGTWIRTNSAGMRDDEPLPEEGGEIRRIVVLGDSFTFGFGVAAEETYSNVLEGMFRRSLSPPRSPPGGRRHEARFEVLNMGVGGYSSRDEALVFRHKAAGWEPDLAIVGYSLNDPEIDPRQPLHGYYTAPRWWQYSHFLRLIAKVKNEHDIRSLGGGDYIVYLHSPAGRKWQSVVDAFADIAADGRENNIPVLLLIFPSTLEIPWERYPYRAIHRQIAAAAEANGLPFLDLLDHYTKYPAEYLMVAPQDAHPSRFGHKVAARVVYRWIVDNIPTIAGPNGR